MASNHIEIGSTTRLSGEVRGCVDGLQQSVNKVRELTAMMAEFGAEWTTLAGQLAVNDTEAQSIYNNFVNALAVLNGADISYFLNRMS